MIISTLDHLNPAKAYKFVAQLRAIKFFLWIFGGFLGRYTQLISFAYL